MKPDIQDIKDHYSQVLLQNDKQAVCCNPYYPQNETPMEISIHSLSTLEPLSKHNIKIGDAILDIGCGAGADCFLASKRTGKNGKVFGIEIVEELINRANKLKVKYGFSNVSFSNVFVPPLPFENDFFDLVIMNYSFHLFQCKLELLREIYRTLKVGAQVIIADSFTPKSIDYFQDKLKWFTSAANAIAFKEFEKLAYLAGFKSVQFIQENIADLPGGEILGYSICNKKKG